MLDTVARIKHYVLCMVYIFYVRSTTSMQSYDYKLYAFRFTIHIYSVNHEVYI